MPAAPEPDLTVIQRLMGLPQTLRAVGQNLAVGAASLPYGIYQGFGNPAAGEAAMSQFQQEYGYTPTNPAAQQQLRGLGEFLQQLETEYKIPPIMAPVAATPALGIRGMVPQTERLVRDLVTEIQTTPPTGTWRMVEIPKPEYTQTPTGGFYSQLEAAVQPLQNKGTGQQYLAQIQKSAGVKPEEIQWTGLDEFLKSKQSVTKQEIQDYLQANRVDVQEVQLGGPESFNQQRLTQLEDEFANLRQHPIDDPSFGEAKYNEMIRLMNIRDQSTTSDLYRQADDAMKYGQRAQARGDDRAAERFFRQYELLNTRAEKLDLEDLGMQNPPKFSQYTLPGGENYREILLTLPTGPRQTRFEVFDPSAQRAIPFETREEAVAFANQDPTRSSVVAEVDVSKPEYRTSHFDQPNILAHLRVNDRTVDGKKTLFVEEIQSDWHQAGRKKGYGSQTETTHEAYYTTPDGQRVSLGFGATQEEAAAAVDPGWRGIVDVKFDSQTRKVSEGVPDAPFKTSWHELSLKRAIQEAAEKGYDQIAFTTGKTQAERYDLSQQIDEINVVGRTNAATGEQTKSVALDTTDGKSLRFGVNNQGIVDNVNDSSMSNFVGKGLDEVIGKDLAKKIMDGGSQTISGEGLKVGGEGMKGFYDNILPKSLDKLGKKFGAKVGKTDMDGVEVWQMDITPQMRESVVTKGQPLFAIPAIGAGLLGAGMMQEEEQF